MVPSGGRHQDHIPCSVSWGHIWLRIPHRRLVTGVNDVESAIVVFGWGSLIWDPRSLPITTPKWRSDGPSVPIEFARISKDGRLTLVLYTGAPAVQILWNYLDVRNVEEAILCLARREGDTSERRIGFVDLPSGRSRSQVIPDLQRSLASWLQVKRFDSGVWTDLPSNLEKRICSQLNEENVMAYI